MSFDDIERTLLVKPEVFIYKIPPRPSAKGYRAADWNLTQPDWTGRLRCLVKGSKCEIRLEDKSSGELFAACPVDQYPGVSVEAVTDSSRYFVICVQDSGRKAYLGMGFADRADSFDLNVSLQDHFKQIRKEEGFTKEANEPPKPNLDLAFKAGQTIRINIPGGSESKSRPSSKPSTVSSSGVGGMLPPPPGGIKLPPSAASLTPSSENVDLLGSLSLNDVPSKNNFATNNSSANASSDLWGDFESAATSKKPSGNWEQF